MNHNPAPLHNIEAEMSTLGAMMLRDQAADAVFPLVSDDDFWHPAHRLIFAAIESLGHLIDIPTGTWAKFGAKYSIGKLPVEWRLVK